MASQGPVIETAGLSKRFGQRVAVAGVDLRVPAGCAFGFLGPNGAGKTTVIRMLLGLISSCWCSGPRRSLAQAPGERPRRTP